MAHELKEIGKAGLALIGLGLLSWLWLVFVLWCACVVSGWSDDE